MLSGPWDDIYKAGRVGPRWVSTWGWSRSGRWIVSCWRGRGSGKRGWRLDGSPAWPILVG